MSAGRLHMLHWVFGTACALGAIDFRAEAADWEAFTSAVGLFIQ